MATATTKNCVRCQKEFIPGSNRAKYCHDCSAVIRRDQERQRERKMWRKRHGNNPATVTASTTDITATSIVTKKGENTMKKNVIAATSTATTTASITATSSSTPITVGVDTTMTHTHFNMRTGKNEKIGLIYKPNADYIRRELERGMTPEELAKRFNVGTQIIHTMGHTEQAKKWWKERGTKGGAVRGQQLRKMTPEKILRAQMMRERGLSDKEIGKILDVSAFTIAYNIGRNTKARKREIYHDAAMLANALRDLADREPAV